MDSISTHSMEITRGMQRVSVSQAETAAAQEAETAADDLSETLVARILEQVPQQQRLSACALVCRSWSAAAADSTRKIKFKANSDAERTAGLSRWLQRHSSSRLMSLEVEGPRPLPATVFNALKGLVQLQELTILVDSVLTDSLSWSSEDPEWPGTPTAKFPSLPDMRALTSLRLVNTIQLNGRLELQQASLALPRLQVLKLEGICFNPRIFNNTLPQLQQLDVRLIITPCINFFLEDDDPAATALDGATLVTVYPAMVMRAFLDSIGQLSQLRTLDVRLNWFGMPPHMIPAPAFAALTASPQLERLFVEFSTDTELMPFVGDPAMLPGRDVLKHMFPTRRQLQQLTQLSLGTDFNTYSNWRVPPADLLRIATSCPRLESFTFHHLLDPNAISNLSPLLSFTSCSVLGLGGQGIGNAAAPIVAQLTQLTKLSWAFCVGDDLDGMAMAELLKLTQLQALELSRSHWHGESEHDASCFSSDALLAEEQQGRRYHCKLTSREAVSSHLLAAGGEAQGGGGGGSNGSNHP